MARGRSCQADSCRYSATTISPASTKATFEIASLVISQATQAFSHILLIYVAVRVRGGGRWNLVLAVAMGALSLSSAAIGSLAGRQVSVAQRSTIPFFALTLLPPRSFFKPSGWLRRSKALLQSPWLSYALCTSLL